jgi:hypothetical protein
LLIQCSSRSRSLQPSPNRATPAAPLPAPTTNHELRAHNQPAYTIVWHCKLGKRCLISDTEPRVNQKMRRHFPQRLKERRDRLFQRELEGRKIVLDSCTVMAQRQRGSRRVFYTIKEKPDRAVQWDPVDNQLEEWAEKFSGQEVSPRDRLEIQYRWQ